jgi:uncharacterized protein
LNVESMWRHFAIFLGLTLSVFGDALFDNTFKEAKNGDALAQVNLGNMYHKGEGVPKDLVESVKWFRKSAEQGNALGQFNLGTMYDNGDGVPKDDVEAVKWYRKSAEQGYAFAQYFLGMMYEKGEGVPKDLVEAHVWFNLAGTKGEGFSQEARAAVEVKLTKFQIAKATKLARERFKRLSK